MQRLHLSPHVRAGDTFSWIEWDLTDPRCNGLHQHRFHEVFWVLEGQGIHHLNGQQHALAAMTLVLVHADDAHTVVPKAGEHLRFVNMAFELSVWKYLRQRYWAEDADPFEAPDSQKHFAMEPRQWNPLCEFAEEIGSGHRDRRALDRFLLNLVYLLPADDQAETRAMPAWLHQGLVLLRSYEVQSKGREEFMARCGRSREHVARVCRTYLGKSPTELVNDARMEHAAALLAQSDKKVTEIALDSGVTHLGHFYCEFQKRYGMTPRAYRLHHQRMIRPR